MNLPLLDSAARVKPGPILFIAQPAPEFQTFFL